MNPSSWPAWTRQTFLLLAWCLVGTSVAQYDPVKDFCRRWGHQSAVVDRRLYIDGGLINYKPFTSSSQNLTNTFLTYNDLNSVTDHGMPPLYANISKNDTIPSVNGGILWEDSVNKRLYLYGGEYHDTSPTAFNLYSYDILYDEWVSFGPPTGAGTINAVSYGAGVSIPERGEAYYYGGWLSNASVPDWSGPPRATNRLIKYTMDSNTWSNLTGPDDVRRAEGAMVFIPIGDAGMLVYFGGSKDLYGNGTLTPQPLNEIFLFDVANGKWYKQKTSGRVPEIRRRFCGGATWAQDQSSYNIYIYGGAGFPPETTGYDDIYILTIPTFQWIRGPYPPGSNITGAFPKSMMSCNIIDNAQMIVIGGTYSNDTTYMCDVDAVWGTHNMDLGEENPENAIWALYKPNLTTYAVPTDILTAVGGRNTGGAVKTKPTSGFDAPDLSVLMTRTAVLATRKPTRQVSFTSTRKSTSTPTSTSKPGDDGSSSSLSTGAIAGIAVGCSVALILALLGCCFFIRRRRKYYSSQRTATTPVSFSGPAMATTTTHQQQQQHQQQHQHHGSMSQGPVHSGLSSAQAVSPTTTAPSYNTHQCVQPAGPPAELGSEGELQYGQRSMSPMSGKFEAGPQLSGMTEMDLSPRQSPDVIYPRQSPDGVYPLHSP